MSRTMLLYKQITALSRDDHRSHRLKPQDGFGFAAGTHWMPVAGVEFAHAARHYPVVFVGEGDDLRPILLLGLEAGRNDYVAADGSWAEGHYLPAFVRRYPFVLAETGAANGDLTVCVDTGCPGWNETEGRELFTVAGETSPFLAEMVQFMTGFATEMKRTTAFMQELRRLELLHRRSADLRSADGRTFQVQDILVVDEEALGKLPGTELEALNRAGFLGWIFAHQLSLGHLPALFERHLAGKAAAVA